jgi:abhydrolase domain-containing protein 8
VAHEKAFDIPTYVLKGIMNGQMWEEGDAEYHEWINAPTLLIHGKEDQLVSIEEENEMVEVRVVCSCLLNGHKSDWSQVQIMYL